MAGFIGNKPGAKYATLTRQTFSTPTGTSHTLSQTVTNSDDLLLYINNVKQNPADYTASGTTLTTASLAGGTEMYCLYYGKTTETVAVPASSVGDSHMVDMAASKLTGALPAISGASLTNLNGSNIASGTLPMARLSGTLPALNGSALTSLPISGSGVSHVAVHQDTGTTQDNVTGDGTTYDILWQTEITDTGTEYASNVFTATTAGKYLISFHCALKGYGSGHTQYMLWVYTSNLTKKVTRLNPYAVFSSACQFVMSYSGVYHLDACDTAKVQVQVTGSTKTVDVQVNTQSAHYLTITKLA